MATEARQERPPLSDNESNGEEADLDPQIMRTMYANMLLARAVDERMWQMNRMGQAPFAVSGQGHEAAQGGMAAALDTSKDWLVPYYRDVTLSIAFGLTPQDILMAQLSRADDPTSGGRQMPNHFSSRETTYPLRLQRHRNSDPSRDRHRVRLESTRRGRRHRHVLRRRRDQRRRLPRSDELRDDLRPSDDLLLPEQRICDLGTDPPTDGRRARC